jgi:hypothetical protein
MWNFSTVEIQIYYSRFREEVVIEGFRTKITCPAGRGGLGRVFLHEPERREI